MLFPAALSGLASPVTLSETGAAPDGQHISHEKVEMLPGRPGRCGCPVKGCRKNTDQEHSVYVVQDSHRPWQIGTKRQNDTAEPKLGDNWVPKSREMRSGTNGGYREQDSGPEHSTPRKLSFYSPQKDKKSAFSTSITRLINRHWFTS